jgi:hypothetical protein
MTRSSSNFSLWLWFFVGLPVVLGLVTWLFWHSQQVEAPNQETQVAKTAVDAPSWPEAFNKLRGVRIGSIDLRDRANSSVSGLRAALYKILVQRAPAQEAIPMLTQVASEFEELIVLSSQLSPETGKDMADSFVAIRPTLDDSLDSARGDPDVGPEIQPNIDEIRSKLDILVQLQPTGP